MRVDLSLDYDDESHYDGKKIRERKKKLKKSNAVLHTGKVVHVAGNLIQVVEDNETFNCSIKGNLKKVGTDKTLIVLGDIVDFDKNECLIHAIGKRKSTLTRRNQLTQKKQVFCANVDQVFITISVASPPLKPSLIDRYLLSAKKGDLTPIILINKSDLDEEVQENGKTLSQWVQEYYEELGITTLKVSSQANHNLDQLKELMKGKISFFSGQSGVGKTSLINKLCKSDFLVQQVHQKTNKGVHTTTQSKLIVFDNETYCIDSPGIKSFALYDLSLEDIQEHFNDLQRYAPKCRYSNCRHTIEEDCGVKTAQQLGQIDPLRYKSYEKLLEEYEQNKSY